MINLLKLTIFIAVLLSLSLGANATEFLAVSGGGSIADTVYDDLFMMGNKIKMESFIDGDLFAFCQEIVHSDSHTVDGNLNAFCMGIQVLGPVEQSVRGFGYSININAPIGRNAMLFGREVTIGPKAVISKNADVYCDKLMFQGNLDGDLRIVDAGEVEITGRVAGNVDCETRQLRIGPDAVIEGDLVYKSPNKAEIDRSAVISGETNWEETESKDKDESAGIILGKIFAWVFSASGYLLLLGIISVMSFIFSIIQLPTGLMIIVYSVMFLISGNLMILLSKEKMKSTIEVINRRFLPSLGLGFILFFVGPVLSLVILFTLVGAPLGISLLLLFGAGLFIAMVFSATFLGWKIWEMLGRKSENKTGHLCYSTGIILLIILSVIPIFGYLLVTIAIMTGLGGLAQTLKTKGV